MTSRFLLVLPVLALGQQAIAQCADPAVVAEATAGLERNYGDVLSDISCDAPVVAAHRILCEDPGLWDMARLDTLAWVYAVENATGRETDHADPPIDETFVAARDACTDLACLCEVLKAHTGESLGGLSPYSE